MLSCGKSSAPPAPNTIQKAIKLGTEFSVGASLGLQAWNDVAVGVIENTPNLIRLVTAAGNKTVEVSGTNLQSLTQSRVLLFPSGQPGIDSNYIGVSSIIRDKNGKLYGVFHGEQHDGSYLPGNVPGFYASIGLVTSTDNGATLTRQTSPLVPSFYSIQVNNGSPDGGIGEPCMLFSKDSSQVFIYYTDHNRMGMGVNIAMAMFNVVNGIPDFSQYYKLNDNYQFVPTNIRSKQLVTGGSDADAIFPQVSYSKYLGKYVMVYTLNAWREYNNGQLNASGLYIRYSSDGISWPENQVQLIKDYGIYWGSNLSYTWHPTIIFSNAEGSAGHLLYSRGPNNQGTHQMYARPFTFE